jgi:hypothetical protein
VILRKGSFVKRSRKINGEAGYETVFWNMPTVNPAFVPAAVVSSEQLGDKVNPNRWGKMNVFIVGESNNVSCGKALG